MKALKIVSIVLLMLAATVGGAASRIWEYYYSLTPAPPITEDEPKMEALISEDVEPDNFPAFGTEYILIAGLDEVDGGRRSDAIALAVIDWGGQSVRMLSIPRDSRVPIPGRGWDKINHAYAYGGMNLLKQTVVNLFGIDIDYFVVVNYDGFPRVIDLLGGIDIDVDKKMVYTDYSAKLFINIPKGQQHMNGKTLLEYVRFRHDPLGDIGRVQRQQVVLGIILEKLKTLSWLKFPELVREALAAVNTDLTPTEVLKLLKFSNSLERERIKLSSAAGKAAYIDNLSYWILDIPKTMDFISGKVEYGDAREEEAPPPVLDTETLQSLVEQIGKISILNGDGTIGLGKRAAQIFQKTGVDVGHTGNARHFDYHTSNVIYPENSREAAEALAQLCGITNKSLIRKDGAASTVTIILGRDKENIFKRLETLHL